MVGFFTTRTRSTTSIEALAFAFESVFDALDFSMTFGLPAFATTRVFDEARFRGECDGFGVFRDFETFLSFTNFFVLPTS